MRCADVMHVNRRAVLRHPARRAGMIQMNVRDQDMGHIGRAQSQAGQPGLQGADRGAGAGFDHHHGVAFVRWSRDRSRAILYVGNFTPVVRHGYRIGVPMSGMYRERIRSEEHTSELQSH